MRGAVETAVGADSSDWIDWADAQPANIYSANATAKELWLTGDVKVDLSKTLGDMADASCAVALDIEKKTDLR